MLSASDRAQLDKSNDWAAAKLQLGKLLHQSGGCIKGNYKFSRDGGAIGDINLKDQDGVSFLKIPSGAVVTQAFAFVRSALTSGGAATVDLNLEAANDLLAAQAVASFTASAKIAGIPDFATIADWVVTTVERTLTLSVNTAALTAGELDVFVFYVF